MANQGKFDGIHVEMYDGKFAGTFEIESELGEKISYDDVVTFMVVTTAGKASIDSNKDGDLKRTNYFDLSQVQILSNEDAAKIMNYLGGAVEGINSGQLSFDNDADKEFTDEEVQAIESQQDLKPVGSSISSGVDKALSSFLDENLEGEEF